MRHQTIILTTILFELACFALVQTAQAVNPPPDGGYPGGNTAEGQDALFSLTDGDHNTAIGANALYSNSIGGANTATGASALLKNTIGNRNTANGFRALENNTTASNNTANGQRALFRNTTGSFNTANGDSALLNNTTGDGNTANGINALLFNQTGNRNTAVGAGALFNNLTGNGNVALGNQAGIGVSNADDVICIGAPGNNLSHSCYIGNIFNQTSVNGMPVLITSDNKLGTNTSSKRFKEGIKPMNQASDALFALKPIKFHYKKEIDPVGTSQFGLVAEDVEAINPDLVVHDQEGKPYSVRYDQVNAMLLNEFLKQHRKVEEQQATIAELKSTVARQRKDSEATAAQQQKEIEALTTTVKQQTLQIQKVSAQLAAASPSRGEFEVSKGVQQMALNNP